MTDAQTPSNDALPDEIDFSHGTRGRFFRPGMRLNLPVYLDDEVQEWLSARAAARGVDITQIVNELLRENMS